MHTLQRPGSAVSLFECVGPWTGRRKSPCCSPLEVERTTTSSVPSRTAPRHRRYLLPLLTAASALLFVFLTASTIRWLTEPRSDVITTDAWSFSYTTDAVEHNTRYPNIRRTIIWHRLGFRFELVRQVLYPRWASHGDNQTIEWGPVATWSVDVPGCACIALSAILPVRWAFRLRRRRREAKVASGICLRCGYDLRFSPQRCPECGEPRQVRGAAAE